MAVNLTDAQIRNLFPTYFTPAALASGPNKTVLDVDKIRLILNTYTNREGGRNYIGKKLGVDQSVVGRIITKAIKQKIIKKVPPGKFTATSQRKYTEENPRNIYKKVREVEPRDYIKNPEIPKNAKFKAQVPSGSVGQSTKMVYGSTKEIVENKIKKAEKFTETRKIEKAKPTKDAVKAIHRIAMSEPEDLNSLKNLSKMVYGSDDVKNLTRTANDLVKYQEFLLGFRPIAGITVPAGDKFDDIISEFPPMNQWGKFAVETIRRSKLDIRDKLLNSKGERLAQLRTKITKFVNSGAMELDEAMGVSATYERAPGYTELGQIIPKAVNQEKGRLIDAPFSKLFEKVVRGDTGLEKEIKDFNKISREFQKINKVDTPIIEYTPGKKIDASKFIKYFDKLTPEAQRNVSQLADQGVALKTTATPMIELFKLAKADAAANGPICRIVGAKQSGGSAVSCVDAVNDALEKDPKRLAQEINKSNAGGTFNKIKNSSTKFLTALKENPNLLRGGLPGKIALGLGTVAAGVGAGALVKQFRNDDPSTYLTNDSQMEGMIIADVEDKGKEVDDNILLDNQFKLELAGAAGLTAPIAKGVYQRARGVGEAGPLPEGRGRIMSALGLNKGVLGKGLWALGAPAIAVPSTIGYVAQDIRAGKDAEEIATNPLNYLGAAFMNPSIKALTKAGASRGLLGLASLGLAGTAAGAVALPAISIGAGLATLGTLGYQGYKLFTGKDRSDEDFFK
jgi:hypothetical protein